MKALLKELTETAGPPGHEEAVREVIRREVEPLADETRVDRLGSLIALRKPASPAQGGRRILVTARMDEPGLIASHIEAGGRVRFAALGQLDRGALAGSRVRFLDGTAGVVGCERTEDSGTLPSLDKFFIDVGADTRAGCPVSSGDKAVLEAPFQELGGKVTAKALDGRAGVLAVIETLRALKSTPHEVCFVFTAQEQVNAHALAAAAFALEPEIALTLEAAPAAAGGDAAPGALQLGSGPAVKIREGYLLADTRIVEWMTGEAERKKIPFQREVRAGSGNAIKVQSSREGVPGGGLSIPVRYLHSPAEMIAMSDLENTIRLLTALLRLPLRSVA